MPLFSINDIEFRGGSGKTLSNLLHTFRLGFS